MKRPCFGYFFNKYCCSLVSYRPLPNAKPVAGKKAGKNKLVLSSVSDLQTQFTAVVQKPETRKMNEFLKETIFSLSFVLVSCFLFLNFARREFYVFPITGNTKVTGCWIFCLCAVRFAQSILLLLGGQCPVVRTAVSANPRLNFSPGFFFFYQKHSLRIIFSIFFRVSNHQIVGKES